MKEGRKAMLPADSAEICVVSVFGSDAKVALRKCPGFAFAGERLDTSDAPKYPVVGGKRVVSLQRAEKTPPN
jgi:hypothetical protein